MHRSIILLLMLALVPATGRPGQQVSEQQRQEITVALQEVVLGMLSSLRQRNAAAALDMYGRHQEFVHIDNGNIVRWQQLESQMRDYLQNAQSNEIYWTGRPNVLVLNEDAAIVYGRHTMRSSDTSQDAHEGEWSGVFQRIDGKWRIVHSHSSDAPPP